MMRWTTPRCLLALAISLTVAGCGASPVAGNLAGQIAASTALAAAHHHGGNGPSPAPNPAPHTSGTQGLTFVTIHATVLLIEPLDTHGLPHQNFEVKQTDGADAGQTLQVNNDIKYGTQVPNLAVGEQLTIRGVEYHDPKANGIHWTHHDLAANDAGFIATPDGKVYQ